MDSYADGILHIAEAQKRVAEVYLHDGSFELACPPLQAILKIMAEGAWNGFSLSSPAVRSLFTRENLMQSDWYRSRLQCKQRVDIALWTRHVAYLEEYCGRPTHSAVTKRLGLQKQLQLAKAQLQACSQPTYLDTLVGCLGVDPATQFVASQTRK